MRLTGQRTPAGSARFQPGWRNGWSPWAPTRPARLGFELRRARVSMLLTGHEKPVWFATYLPDGSGIDTASVDGTARLWEAATGKQVRVFQGHQGPVLHAAVSSDGRLLATASADSTAGVWRSTTDRCLPHCAATPRRCVVAARCSPDGSRVATALCRWNGAPVGCPQWKDRRRFQSTPKHFLPRRASRCRQVQRRWQTDSNVA